MIQIEAFKIVLIVPGMPVLRELSLTESEFKLTIRCSASDLKKLILFFLITI